jgi:hypothetical protein
VNDPVQDARSSYWVAYETYRVCAARVATIMAAGDVPSDADIKAEERALSDLNTARRRLLDVLAEHGSR